jgi:transcriptional regulator with XRE-family HTH domain
MTAGGISARQLAMLERVGFGTVSRWRRGELPDDLRLPSLAGNLTVRLNWLKSGQGEMRAGPEDNGDHLMAAESPARYGAGHPVGDEAQEILFLELNRAVRNGDVPSQEQIRRWLQLALWAIRPPDAADGPPAQAEG